MPSVSACCPVPAAHSVDRLVVSAAVPTALRPFLPGGLPVGPAAWLPALDGDPFSTVIFNQGPALSPSSRPQEADTWSGCPVRLDVPSVWMSVPGTWLGAGTGTRVGVNTQADK